MPRGIPAKTKAERIERLLRLKWSKERIIETAKCSEAYVYMIKKRMEQDALAAQLMKRAG
jgi:hypothetical protein